MEPRILATVYNVSFGNTPKWFDIPETPKALIGLVVEVLRARLHTRSFSQAWCANPSCTLCESNYNDAYRQEIEASEPIWSWFGKEGRRWNRYQVGEFFVYATKGDEQGRFYSTICDRAGRIPCCGCGSFGQRVEFALNAKPFVPDARVVKRCPICEGRGTILVSSEVARLAEKDVAHVI